MGANFSKFGKITKFCAACRLDRLTLQVGFTKQHFNAMNIIILHYDMDAQLWAPMNFIIA